LQRQGTPIPLDARPRRQAAGRELPTVWLARTPRRDRHTARYPDVGLTELAPPTASAAGTRPPTGTTPACRAGLAGWRPVPAGHRPRSTPLTVTPSDGPGPKRTVL